MKIIVLPLFRLPSGHHKAAEAIIERITCIRPDAQIQTLDLLSYCHESLETVVSKMYMQWISKNPESYSKFYKSFIYTPDGKRNEQMPIHVWDKYFEFRLARFIEKERPDYIICTHSYPSKLLNHLKRQRKIDVPVINVYTDFFVSDVWGKRSIDYHFVPHPEAKKWLTKLGVPGNRIFITGIPVHPSFEVAHVHSEHRSILVAGGNSGLGHLEKLLNSLHANTLSYTYNVLCGHNIKLRELIMSFNNPRIKALPYMSSREEMNRYYEEASAIITKPGGITVSEVLEKELPVFIAGALPGQEEFNADYLKKRQLIYELTDYKPVEQQITTIIDSDIERSKWKKRLDIYRLEKEHTLETTLINIFGKESSSIPL
jgi:processive 1,2-diacylglycerol beta-glucosyltransferase